MSHVGSGAVRNSSSSDKSDVYRRMLIPRTLVFAVEHLMGFANAGAWLGMSRRGVG